MKRSVACTARRRRSASATVAGRTSTSTDSTRCRTRACASPASSVRKMERSRANAGLFWSVIAAVVISDVITKWIAYTELTGVPYPREVIGEAVRFWLVYNRGAAFGLHVGEYSRWVFMILTIGALVILTQLYRQTRAGDRLRTLSLALVCGGAV